MEGSGVQRTTQSPRKILKWAGSKSNVSSQLKQFLTFDRPYIEPFCGSAAFYFERLPSKSALNDLNSHLIDCYRSIRDDPLQVWKYYDELEVSEENYYKVRANFNRISKSHLKSSLFLFLNHYCFNGIYRTNKSGLFNTPYGAREKVKKKFSTEDFKYFSASLQTTELHSEDFESFLDNLAPTDSCIYMDPPYFTVEGRVFNEYDAKTFLAKDLARLHTVATKLAADNIVVISYKNCSEFRDLFERYLAAPITVTRNVGGFAGRRKSETELIAVLGG
ncbi:Dam family site-specific DNA-(adenine-N6)-methyltransferase [Rhizobium leguminosarum]|uniref:DNA adenine methylase n=1 Tax=Rhizobium leguminosarum TaxID=384 RepID=UPI001C95A9BB|nr:Dam family site-specific DNA-(adenine-N6)-methyltransferase [Rhizobium leguminosarum]MBY5367403.1 Dam family site-specific DNA-(adenine-N6)-methyltransferase [Rhizobium leguminosarum]MBY5449951.1 Dam family site-specific DNA-(adenine-N6)-methyltransferase [Rhizobium leguminosarum]